MVDPAVGLFGEFEESEQRGPGSGVGFDEVEVGVFCWGWVDVAADDFGVELK